MRRPTKVACAVAIGVAYIGGVTAWKHLPKSAPLSYELGTNTELKSFGFTSAQTGDPNRAFGITTLLPGQTCIAKAGGRLALSPGNGLIYHQAHNTQYGVSIPNQCPSEMRIQATPELANTLVPNALIRTLIFGNTQPAG